MSESEPVFLELEGDIVTITLNRPDVRNALDRAAVEVFTRVARAALSARPKLIIVTGTGGSFGSGGDLADFADVPDRAGAAEMTDRMASALQSIRRSRAVSIAAVDGVCYGGGIEIALHCDLRVASSSARFGFAQGRIGLITGWRGGVELVRSVGRNRALQLLARQQVLSADEALAIGLIDEVSDGPALPRAREWAREMLENLGGSLAAMKAVVDAAATLPQETARDYEREEFLKLWVDPVRADAMRDVLARIAERKNA